MQLCSTLSFLWYCLSLGLEWKLNFSSPVGTAEFSQFAGILSVAVWGLGSEPSYFFSCLWEPHSWNFSFLNWKMGLKSHLTDKFPSLNAFRREQHFVWKLPFQSLCIRNAYSIKTQFNTDRCVCAYCVCKTKICSTKQCWPIILWHILLFSILSCFLFERSRLTSWPTV